MKNKNAANAIAVLIPYLRAAAFIVLVIMLEIVHAKAWSYDENGLAEDQFRLIEQSKQTRSEEKLIIGDSVASQLFGNEIELVASSRISTGGLDIAALAIASSCLCPCDRFAPSL